MEFSKNLHALIQNWELCRKCRFQLYFMVPTLKADLQFGLGLSDLCCFRENMTELSPDLRQLLCE
ncbi:hypothetical protein T11_6924 [Trichinella zimbabwensis]|uniref:Uncharacterized protein n=1 Tax=Trichinella zimbabwensis TaxID=268475 RepID=A0A0V1GWF1_9BILA|nr:hypothetical protein T11_6924 [Trichinella zimbabwensis]